MSALPDRLGPEVLAEADYAVGDAGDLHGLGGLLDNTPAPSDLEQLMGHRQAIDPKSVAAEISSSLSITERHRAMRVAKDVVGVLRHYKGGVQTYLDKLREGRESAFYGTGTVPNEHGGEEPVVAYVMDFGGFAGSLGQVAGAKYDAAAELAADKGLPFIGVYSSSGARQQEAVPGLLQMPLMAGSISRFRERSRRPHIAVMAGQVWGGVSASAAPLADFRVGLSGTNFGFSGPRVIETFQSTPVPQGAQSVEAAMLDRNVVDAIAVDTPELVHYLGRYLNVVRDRRRLTADTVPELRLVGPRSRERMIKFGPQGIGRLLVEDQIVDHEVAVTPRREPESGPIEDRLMSRFEALIGDAGRLDTEEITQTVFSDVVPLYNHYTVGNRKVYPPIIGSIGRIGKQPFLIIGNQPSYEDKGDRVRRLPPNPKPQDYEHQVRIMKLIGERYGLPIVFLTDTLGAEPTLASERRGQARAIAEAIQANVDYPYPIITVVTGALGSGGGMATGAMKEKVLMMSDALAFVAEPTSSAAILNNVANPSYEQVKLTLATSKATALDNLELGIVDGVIDKGEGPYETALNIRAAIISSHLELQGLSSRKRRQIVDNRLRPRGIYHGPIN